MTPAKQLETIGKALYGEQWIGHLANDLEVNRETVRRWLTGKTPLAKEHGVFHDMFGMLMARESQLMEARLALQKWMAARV
jgi:hypothetical protein